MQTVRAAPDGGVTLLDTADRYGDGDNERLLAAKAGFVGRSGQGRPVDGRPVDGRPEHPHAAARASLARLEVEHVDLLYLHRVDPQVPVEESVGALAELVTAGLVHHIGLSGGNGRGPEPRRRGPPGRCGPDRVLAVEPRSGV